MSAPGGSGHKPEKGNFSFLGYKELSDEALTDPEALNPIKSMALPFY
jgi:hypothetical protein